MNVLPPRFLHLLTASFLGVSALLRGETVLLDFGNDDSFRGVSVPAPDVNGNYWNSVRPGMFFTNLLGIDNVPTTVAYGPGAHPTDSYNGPSGATSNPPTALEVALADIDAAALGPLGIAEAAFDYHVGVLGEPSGRFQIEGLNPAAVYTLTFYGAHKYISEGITRYRVYGDSDRLSLLGSVDLAVGTSGGTHNRDKVAILTNIAPPPSGVLYFEFGGADGTSSGYLNAMSVSTESPGVDPDPDPDAEPSVGIKLVVAGSSVPAGSGALEAGTYYHDFDQDGSDDRFGGWEDDYSVYGYTGRLREHLTAPENPRLPGGSTTPWEWVNVSVPGDNTTLLRGRFNPDVTRQYVPPKTARSAPDYVLIALSMANEGLVYSNDPRGVFNSFRDGMLDLIAQSQTRGYYPVVTLVYPHAEYTPEKYAYVQEMNLLMNTWGVPAINLLGGIDNGAGQWADGFFWDNGHPNFLGHEELYYTIPPSLFDAIHFDGKRSVPTYPASPDFARFTAAGATSPAVVFEPAEQMRSFTTSFRVRSATPGTVAAVRSSLTPRFLIDFGPNNEAEGRPTEGVDGFGHRWNNWQPAATGEAVPAGAGLTDLIAVDGSATSVGLQIISPFTTIGGLSAGGLTGANGPSAERLGHLAVETATEDYFATDGTATIAVTGLDPAKRYTFRLFGSRADSEPRETRYRVTGTTTEVNFSPFVDIFTSGAGLGAAGGNESAIGLVSGITPRADGQVFVEVLPDPGVNAGAFLNAMEISVETPGDRYGTIALRTGGIAYVAPDGREIFAAGSGTGDEWHHIALSHRYAQQQTILYVDGVEMGLLRENLQPDRFVLGGPDASGRPASPASADLQDWAVNRAAWTAAEAAAQSAGQLQHASLEILAPLDDDTWTPGGAVTNLAQSRSEAVVLAGQFEARKAPAAPLLTAVSYDYGTVRLSWEGDGPAGFAIERQPADGSEGWSVIARPGASERVFLDTLTEAGAFTYRMIADDGSEQSVFSAPVTVSPGQDGLSYRAWISHFYDLAPATYRIDFNTTADPDYGSEIWNTVATPAAGGPIGLVDASNDGSAGYSLTVEQGFGTTVTGNTADDSAFVVTTADEAAGARLRLHGLNRGFAYSVAIRAEVAGGLSGTDYRGRFHLAGEGQETTFELDTAQGAGLAQVYILRPDAAGTITLELTATDSPSGPVFAALNYLILRELPPATAFLLDLNANAETASYPAGEVWNYLTDPADTDTRFSLVDHLGFSSPVEVQLTVPFETTRENETISLPAGVASEAELRLFKALNSGSTVAFYGLDPARRYDLVFLARRGANVAGFDYRGVYTANGASTTAIEVDAADNEAFTTFGDLSPDASGSLSLTVAAGSGEGTDFPVLNLVMLLPGPYLDGAAPPVAPGDNADGDAFDNITEYALGRSPREEEGALLGMDFRGLLGRSVNFAVDRNLLARDVDLVWQLESTTDLANPASWSPEEAFEETAFEPDGFKSNLRLPLPEVTVATRFYRLRLLP